MFRSADSLHFQSGVGTWVRNESDAVWGKYDNFVEARCIFPATDDAAKKQIYGSYLRFEQSKVEAKARETKDAELIQGAKAGNVQAVQAALSGGANVNGKDKDGTTALRSAAERGHTEVVKLLLEKDADVNVKTTDDVTALYQAAAYDHPEVVKLLLGKGADVNVKTTDGVTALFIASQQGNAAVVKLLLEAKADINVKVTVNWRKYTPLSKAALRQTR